MKRLGSSDSLGAMIPVCTSAEEKISSVYNRGFQPILDSLEEEDCVEESGQTAEKKRRLSVEQVKALEKNFEVENKLEPERKLKLAQELGLQPRQVAVWFQNRRARWKTKQLERDYSVLKANYEALKVNYEALSHDKEALLTEIRELKSKLQGSFESDLPIKEEIVQSESDQKVSEQQSQITAVISGSENATATDQNPEHYGELFGELKDGSSDSDSSAILNDDNSPHSANSSGVLPQMMASPTSLRYNFSSSSSSSNSMANCLQFSDLRLSASAQKGYYHQFLRIEEPSFGEEACNFFSDEQAPTLSWYCSETLN